MSTDFEDLEELEARLRQAHSFSHRPGLEAEIRGRLRPARLVPWAGFSAAAAVLLAVVGVGLVLRLGAPAQTALAPPAGSGTGAGRYAVQTFGKLPQPPAGQHLSLSGAGSTADTTAPAPGSKTTLPGQLPVYRVPYDASSAGSCAPAGHVLGGYPVAGSPGCAPAGQQESAIYQLRPAPDRASIAYLAVRDGQVVYFEPVYVLPDGTIAPAVTPSDLRG